MFETFKKNDPFIIPLFLETISQISRLVVHLTIPKKTSKTQALIYETLFEMGFFLLQMVPLNILIAPRVPSVIVFEELGAVS